MRIHSTDELMEMMGPNATMDHAYAMADLLVDHDLIVDGVLAHIDDGEWTAFVEEATAIAEETS